MDTLMSWFWKKIYDLRLSLCLIVTEEMVVILLSLLAGGTLGEGCLGHLSEVIE